MSNLIRKKHPVVQARAGISLVSISNASENLQKEISDRFGWDFDAVVQKSERCMEWYFQPSGYNYL